ncbi:hypothetical protein KUTeg_012781 [Tegillarca granosa]|uniref:Sushi domain-containing protein n=1 Tax=Tegillarca granosa TaxID=220873 RepID=A0ABQ9F3Z3_TEGGR|nr:hypothetical protein KUTeg_012781 [Tegillarca granosa]
MVVGKYKKPNREKGDSKGYKLLNQANQDSQSDKVLNEVICDSQDDEIPNEKTEDTKSYQIDKKEKVKKLCKRKCIILIAVCVMFLLTSVVITFKITNKGTSVFSTNCSTPPDVTSSSYEISEEKTTVKRFNCGSPPNVPYSTHKTKSNMSGAVTTYRCLNGYVPVGETNIYCKANDCGRPPPIYHSNSFYQSTYTNSKKHGIYITSSQPLNLFWFLMKNDREGTKLKTNVLENITPGDWVKIEMSTKLNYKIIY